MMTPKERFFHDHLVPAGQILEVLRGIHYTSIDSNDVCVGFDALGLASCYVIHPHTTTFDDVQAAVNNLTCEMLTVIETLGSARGDHISKVVREKYASAMRVEFGRTLAALIEKLPGLCKAIYAAVQFSPEKRAEWLQAYTSTTSALTTGGRSNRWRTFVRNLSWTQAAELMKVKERLEKDNGGRFNGFRSDAGEQKATSLWAQVFAETIVVPAPTTGGEPARAMVPVPDGVQIAVTPDKLLGVSVTFDPTTLLGADRNKEMAVRQQQGQALSLELSKTLAPCHFQEKTDIVGLAEVVSKAESWIAQQRNRDAMLCELYGQWLTSMRLADVRKKLGKHFSADEHALLLQALAETSGTLA